MSQNFFLHLQNCKRDAARVKALAKENLTRKYSHTFMGASLLSSSASRRTPLAVLTRRRGKRQDNGKRSMGRCVLTSRTVIPAHVPTTLIYVVAATIIDATLRRSLCLSLSLWSLFSLSLLSPFSRPSLSPHDSLRALSGGSFYSRHISMVGPQEDPWNGDVGR